VRRLGPQKQLVAYPGCFGHLGEAAPNLVTLLDNPDQKASMTDLADRSIKRFREQDLVRLAEIAAADQADFLSRNPRYVHLRDGLICMALCQGGAQHHVDCLRGAQDPNGVKDLDVYTFYRRIRGKRDYHPQRQVRVDYGDPWFGRHPDDKGYKGRRIDLLGRSIPGEPGQDPAEALQAWLRTSTNNTPRLLAEKAVVLLTPASRRGEIVWPTA
jgi:hypothetical protein